MFPPVNHTPAMMPDSGDAVIDFHVNLKAADDHKPCYTPFRRRQTACSPYLTSTFG